MKREIRKKFALPSKFILVSLFFLFIFSLNSISAFGYNSDPTGILNVGSFPQNSNINLIQTCANCSFTNITTIQTPNGLININSKMTKSGTFYTYVFTSNNTIPIGTYIVNGVGDENGINAVWSYSFNVNGGNLGFFILAFLVFYGITFFGLYKKNEWIALVGSIGLLLLGMFTSFNGVDVYKNDLTKALSYITLAIGLGIGFESLREITYL